MQLILPQLLLAVLSVERILSYLFLDPSVLRNVKFATVKVRRVPDAAWMPLGGSGNLRGRLQNMVPPTMSEMASPAPTHGGMAAARPASRSVAWRGPGVGMK